MLAATARTPEQRTVVIIPLPLKDMVREMIRPMLKAWLDDKLPAMVDRLVRTEIERRRS